MFYCAIFFLKPKIPRAVFLYLGFNIAFSSAHTSFIQPCFLFSIPGSGICHCLAWMCISVCEVKLAVVSPSTYTECFAKGTNVIMSIPQVTRKGHRHRGNMKGANLGSEPEEASSLLDSNITGHYLSCSL